MLTRILVAAVAFLAYLAPPTDAQCFGPDGLDSGPCCTPVNLTLPPLPTLTIPSLGICWNNCNVSTQTCNQTIVFSPTPGATCGQFVAPIGVLDCSSNLVMWGYASLDYTRTWVENTPPPVNEYQVWRFAVKVDMNGVQPTPSCPTPTCIPGSSPLTAFFYGYIDYALNCTTGAWESSIVLFHGCDAFTHDPFYSCAPGSFHPNLEFAIVGPHTTAAPFVPSPVPTPTGVMLEEAMRSTWEPLPGMCLAEEKIVQGDVLATYTGCFCGGTTPMNTSVAVQGSGSCGGRFSTLNAWPTVPWYDLVTTGIGRWSTATTYPGPEAASVAEGVFLYGTDGACSASGALETSVDIFYGGITQNGFTVVPPAGVILTQNFYDLASNYSVVLPGPFTFPLLGCVAPTAHVLYFNL